MSLYTLVPPHSEVLNQVAEEVPLESISTSEIQSLIDAMFGIAQGEQGDKERKTMVGLAASQLGVLKRIIIVGVDSIGLGEKPKLEVFINPELTYMSEDTEDGREGCYSTGRVCGVVKRSSKVTVKALDRSGNEFSETYIGFPARVFQHEIDHLNGVRFPDKITDETKLHWVEPERFGEYRHRWAEWEVICPRDKWESVKAGQI